MVELSQPVQPAQGLALVVGIGASAGGLAPLEQFFDVVPPGGGIAYVVIQHLSPHVRHVMDELIARHTRLAVHRVSDGMPLEPDGIYLIPPRMDMTVDSAGCLRLTLQVRDAAHPPMPIDAFFRSLAAVYGERAVGVVVSGTGSDGTEGMRAIREAGGFTLAQDRDTAQFDGMPGAAIEAGIVDVVGSPGQLAHTIQRFRENRKVVRDEISRQNDPTQLHGVDAIMRVLRDHWQIDFSHYKPSTVFRRIERRIQLGDSASLEAYVERLREDPIEVNALYRDLLIGVTRFFRDAAAFELLRERTFSPIFEHHLKTEAEGSQQVRVWSAGCATGEEPYSLAMLLNEQAVPMASPPAIQVFATDVHRASLEVASRGEYPIEAIGDVPEDLLDRYFTQTEEGFEVARGLRRLVTFAPHNLIQDAPFTNLDLVCCRNLLIYFQPSAQRHVLSMFHYALRPGAYLWLGPSESVGDLAAEFQVVDKHWRIFRKLRDVRLPPVLSPAMSLPRLAMTRTPRGTGADLSRRRAVDPRLLRAYDAILGQFVGPALLVDDRRELLHTFGNAQALVRPPQGRNSRDLLDMLDTDLSTAVGAGISRASRDQEAVTYERVRAGADAEGQPLLQTVTVIPLPDPDGGAMFYLIRFEGTAGDLPTRSAVPILDEAPAPLQKVSELEAELRFTRENLQAALEEMEASNEELNATNEELVSSNEELQSANEELHSLNEELHTVNAEYQRKIIELTELTNDLNNLIGSTAIGTVFLDANLCVRKFTPAIETAFHLRLQDLGRPLAEISHRLDIPDLIAAARSVLDTEQVFEQEARDPDGAWYLLRLLPYRVEHGDVDGVVLTLVDISPVKGAEERLRVVAERAQMGVWELVPDATPQVRAREEMARLVGVKTHELPTSVEAWGQMIHPDDWRVLSDVMDQCIRGAIDSYDQEFRMRFGDGQWHWVAGRGVALARDGRGRALRLGGVLINIDRLKQSQQELARSEQRFRAFMDNAPGMAWIKDAQGRYLHVNRAFRAFFGVDESIVGRTDREQFRDRPEVVQVNCHNDGRVRETGGPTHAIESLSRPGQEPTYWMVTKFPMASDGASVGGIAFEVTAERRALAELQQANQRLVEQNNELDQFAYVASHDLQTPLRTIIGFSEHLEAPVQAHCDATARSHLQRIIKAGRRMHELIDALLMFSRVNRAQLNIVDVAMESVLTHAIEDLAAPIRTSGAEIDSDPLPVLSADQTLIRQLLVNLLSNAIKFVPAGRRPQVRVTAVQREGRWIIGVLDNGLGIDPSQIDQAFEPFKRLQRDAQFDGSGVGLSICRRVVDRHGGQIWVEPGRDGGSHFRFTLAGEGAAMKAGDP